MSEDATQECGNCRFWLHLVEGSFAECRRRAPVAQLAWFSRELGEMTPGHELDLAWEARWPLTHFEAWCGEWEKAP